MRLIIALNTRGRPDMTSLWVELIRQTTPTATPDHLASPEKNLERSVDSVILIVYDT